MLKMNRVVKQPFLSEDFPWRVFLIGTSIALVVLILLVWVLMQAPLSDISTLVTTLSVTSLVSLGVGYILVRRSGARFNSLNQTLIVTYGWSAIIVFINVWFMLSQMFISLHDLILSGVLLLFAGIIATTFGVCVAANITDSLSQLEKAARQISEGNLEERVKINGKDEVARLGKVFNKMATQLEETKDQQEQLDKLRRDLIAWTSHDLRTPLTSIRAMIEALHDGIVADEHTVQRYYQTIRSDIISLNTLIDDLFELAQLDAGGIVMEKSNHSLRDIISDALESFQAIAVQSNIKLSGDVSPDLDSIPLNAPKIARVLNNLLINALRFTPTNGEVKVIGYQEGNEVVVTIEDSGDGFSEADLVRVFEQFYRGEEARSRSTGGAGLGLAIARAIVSGHGGQIWAENRSEKGARVGFRLPMD